MNLFHAIDDIQPKPYVATIGIFDGVHLAHRHILQYIRQKASEKKTESLLITLWPHPRFVLNKHTEGLYLLTTLEEKIQRVRNSGVDNLLIIPFTRGFANTPFSEFIEQMLVKQLHVEHLVVGYNHHFGRNREGNYENLQQLAVEIGLSIERMDPVYVRDKAVSSSMIRQLLLDGEVAQANLLLGSAYSFTGKVMEGRKLGRTIQFPTANLSIDDQYKLIPAIGVYAVRVRLEGNIFDGMMNIGRKPTLGNFDPIHIEVHLMNFTGDLYHQTLHIDMIDRIRDEQKFDSLDALREQLERDKIIVKEILSKQNR